MDFGLGDIATAAMSGGVIVKLLEWLLSEHGKRVEARKSAKVLLNQHMDPILAAADELVGKLRSLAQSDFAELIGAHPAPDGDLRAWSPHLDVIYLFGEFWARVQLLRMDGYHIRIAERKEGKRLLSFLAALEAKKTRLVDRGYQRAIGESLIEFSAPTPRIITLAEFSARFLVEPQFRNRFEPLVEILTGLADRKARQPLLLFGVVLHALVDTLDPRHAATRDRPAWANKLTVASRRDLRYRVFRVFLDFVDSPEKYFAVPERKR